MIKWLGTLVFAVSAAPSTITAQDIVLNDSAPPMAASHLFSENCSPTHHYGVEISSTAKSQRVLAHMNDQVLNIDPPNLLAQIRGYDLYSVRMHCSNGGLFIIQVRKEDGKLYMQTIIIHDDGGNYIGPITLVKHYLKAN